MMMRTTAEWLTPVKATGMAAYLVAAVCCAATGARSGNRRVARLAGWLCVLDLYMLLDVAFDWRWKLYDRLRTEAVSLHWYDERWGPQIAALAAIGIAVLAAAVWLSHEFRSIRGATMAICGGLLSIGCWLTEVVSLHATDAVLFRSAGPLLVVSFVWIGACAMMATGILRAGGASR